MLNKDKVQMPSIGTNKLHYLDMLQGAINRMSNNSFKIKNWTIVVFAGLLSLYFSKGRGQILVVAIVIAILFYILDAYYLAIEREYCQKHKDIVFGKQILLFDMKINVNLRKLLSALASPAMLPYWATIAVSLIIQNWHRIISMFSYINIC